MSIQWFPGHMTKAKREMEKNIKVVDMVIEIRDARIPNSSANPMLQQICANKPRLIILSKSDKAEANITSTWIESLSKGNDKAIAMDLLKDDIVKVLTRESQLMMKPKIDKQIARGIRPTAIRAMVCGIPNVGKSTLINRVAKKKVAQTGDRPGVTKSLQWVKVSAQLELLDTPGVLWPKFDDQKVGYALAVTGAIKDEILPIEDISYYAMDYLLKHYPNHLKQRYDIEQIDDPMEALEKLGRKRGFLRAGNQVDITRSMQTLLREIRNDSLGRISWEQPDENA